MAAGVGAEICGRTPGCTLPPHLERDECQVSAPIAMFCRHEGLTLKPQYGCPDDEPLYPGDTVVTRTTFDLVDGSLVGTDVWTIERKSEKPVSPYPTCAQSKDEVCLNPDSKPCGMACNRGYGRGHNG